MSEVTQDDVVAALGNMSVIQLIQLTKDLEKLWGVEAKPMAVTQVHNPGQQEVKQEQTEFTVSLVSFPADKKIGLVKLVREVLGLGLLESKSLVESVPKPLKEGISKDEVEALKTKFAETGAVLEVK